MVVRVDTADSHLLLVSEDIGNNAALAHARERLLSGMLVTWVCSTATSAAFLELEDVSALKNAYMSRLNLLVITREENQPFDVLTGELDQPRMEHCAKLLFAADSVTEALVASSPQRGFELARLIGQAIPAIDANQVTQLNPQVPGETPAGRPATSQLTTNPDSVAVTVIMQGRESKFSMDRTKGTLLDGAEDAGIDLPFSCRGGVCSTCRAKLRAGQVELIENYALEDWELDAGFTLPCQAEPVSEEITLDYDEI